MGQFKTALLVLHRAGERSLFIAEQLAFHEFCGQGRAVQPDQGLARAGTDLVNGLGQQFLARAGFPAQEHRSPARRDLGNLLQDQAHAFGDKDDVLRRKTRLGHGKPLGEQMLFPGHVFLQAGHLLGDDSGDDLQELPVRFQNILRHRGQIHAEHAQDFPFFAVMGLMHHRHADKGQAGHLHRRPAERQVQEVRMLADPGHDHYLPSGQHPAGHALAFGIGNLGRLARPMGQAKLQAAGMRVANGQEIAHVAQILGQDAQDGLQAVFQGQVRTQLGQDLANGVQVDGQIVPGGSPQHHGLFTRHWKAPWPPWSCLLFPGPTRTPDRAARPVGQSSGCPVRFGWNGSRGKKGVRDLKGQRARVTGSKSDSGFPSSSDNGFVAQ